MNKKISRKSNGDVVLYETDLLNSKLIILQDRNYARDGIRLPKTEANGIQRFNSCSFTMPLEI